MGDFNVAATALVIAVIGLILGLVYKLLAPLVQPIRIWFAVNHEKAVVALIKELAKTAVKFVRDSTQTDQLMITGAEKLDWAVEKIIELAESHGLVDLDDDQIRAYAQEAYVNMIAGINTFVDDVLLEEHPNPEIPPQTYQAVKATS